MNVDANVNELETSLRRARSSEGAPPAGQSGQPTGSSASPRADGFVVSFGPHGTGPHYFIESAGSTPAPGHNEGVMTAALMSTYFVGGAILAPRDDGSTAVLPKIGSATISRAHGLSPHGRRYWGTLTWAWGSVIPPLRELAGSDACLTTLIRCGVNSAIADSTVEWRF